MAKFKCKERCGDCCRAIDLEESLINKHKNKFQTLPGKIVKTDFGIVINTEDGKCVFLNRMTRRCAIYEERPQVCLDYGNDNKCPFFNPDGAPKPELRLDFACGNNKRDGFVGVDMVQTLQSEIIQDLESYPYPWPDNLVEEINCAYFLECVEDQAKFINECYRIIKPNGKMTVACTHLSSILSWSDPTKKNKICEETFLYFDRDWRDANKLDRHPITANFKIENMIVSLNPPWNARNEEMRQFAKRNYWNAESDIAVELRAVKP